MATNQLALLYQEVKHAFNARPSDLQRCGTLLEQLKVPYIFRLMCTQLFNNVDRLALLRQASWYRERITTWTISW